MSENVIEVENLSKLYRLGTVGTGSLVHDVNRWWHTVRGKEDPYSKIGESNDRSSKGSSDYVWALKDINFSVKQGEVLGIIGKNGAGKSTLLKILSQITRPTSGNIKIKGRVASLLEVGTGFHPDLTGRENIYINGAVLGMNRREINKKLDEIIEFSGCERYIDTPVKRYSSGMTVRLGFAVAAHLEPEILIVDEVLAVGDAEFQKKALGKMQDVMNEGRTVIFVSHNMPSVLNLCSRSMILVHGQTFFSGDTQECVNLYLDNEIKNAQKNFSDLSKVKRTGSGNVVLKEIGLNREIVSLGEDLCLEFKLKANQSSRRVNCGFSFHNNKDDLLTVHYSESKNFVIDSLRSGEEIVLRATIPSIPLGIGEYTVGVRILEGNMESDWVQERVASFAITEGDFYKTGKIESNRMLYYLNPTWEVR